jgi:hypothetical protein
MFTLNNHYYIDIFTRLESARNGILSVETLSPWYQKLIDAVNEFNWDEETKGNKELKERVINYFFAFCALWKVRVKSFIDSIDSCCRFHVQVSIRDILSKHLGNVDEGKISHAFASFNRLQSERGGLERKLKRLEEAHSILCDGRLPALQPSMLKMASAEESNGKEKRPKRENAINPFLDDTDEVV